MGSTDFDEFFRREYPRLVGFLQKCGFEREQAKDAAAEAMTHAYASWPQLIRPEAWVRTTAYRTACKQVKRAREEFHRVTDIEWFNAIHHDIDPTLTDEENNSILQLLDKLPTQQRRVFVWHLEGFDIEEISDQLKMKSTTVRSNLRHARERLKTEYQGRSTRRQYAIGDEGEGAIA